MKKNILTVIIMAITLINTVLLAVMIFTVVPAASKTTRLMDKVASIIELELESPDENMKLSVSDIVTYNIEDKLTVNLKSASTDPKDKPPYAVMNVSLSVNSKSADYDDLFPKLQENENAIKEIVQEEFAVYTRDEVYANKGKIKDRVIDRIKELMQSDFVINVSFGSLVLN